MVEEEGRNDLPWFGRTLEAHLYTAFGTILIREILIDKQQMQYQKRRGRHYRESNYCHPQFGDQHFQLELTPE